MILAYKQSALQAYLPIVAERPWDRLRHNTLNLGLMIQ